MTKKTILPCPDCTIEGYEPHECPTELADPSLSAEKSLSFMQTDGLYRCRNCREYFIYQYGELEPAADW